MFKWVVWNVDRAKPVNRRPLAHNRAGRLADIMEARQGEHMVLREITA